MSVRRVSLAAVAACAALGASASPGQAAPGRPPATPHVLPGTSAQAARTDPSTWLIGSRLAPATRAAARAHGARLLSPRGVYLVTRSRARAFARALKAAGTYRFAEPDVSVRTNQAAPVDDFAATDWRTPLLGPGLQPPPLDTAPLTAVIDTAADITHPDLAGMRSLTALPVTHWHGTAVASVLAARANGVGMVGLFPGAPVVTIGTTLKTSEFVAGVAAAVDAGARVINMSFGLGMPSMALFLEIADAVSQDVLPVASAGNDRLKVVGGVRNRVVYPAAWPHVLSVSSIGPAGASSRFSTANGAVDVAAPGEAVLAAVPVAFDTDGVADGYSRVSGTSFAAPIVAGAAAWLMTARPELSARQVADTLRWTATDIAPEDWDTDTGFGRIDLAAALREPEPDEDGVEVDDNIAWVDGSHFENPDPYVYRGLTPTEPVNGTVDVWKDPADVHRVLLPAGSGLRVTLRMAADENPNLAIFTRAARTIYKRPGLIGRSFRPTGRPDVVAVRNRGRRAATCYVAVYAPREDTEFLDSGYSLTFERLPLRGATTSARARSDR